MVAYMNLHLAFEQMRVKALRAVRNSPSMDETEGIPDGPPRVLVLGPDDAGKTTACKILTNYAVRTGQGWTPMLVNTDPSEVNIHNPPFCSHWPASLFKSSADRFSGRLDRSGYYLRLPDRQPAPNDVPS